MDKTIFKNIKATKLEIQEIQRELQNLPMTKDSVHGSMPEFPYIQHTVVIRGMDMQQGDKLRRRLGNKLVELQRQLAGVEDALDQVTDSELRLILRLKLVNGLKDWEIAAELGYSRSAITTKLNNFYREQL